MSEDTLGFDEDKAVEFIRQYVGPEISKKYSDDEILFIIDTIWDYYESKGMLSLNDIETEEELLNVEHLTAYVKKEVKADDQLLMDPADVQSIVKAELEYEKSIEGDF